jgi:hypothetical protein
MDLVAGTLLRLYSGLSGLIIHSSAISSHAAILTLNDFNPTTGRKTYRIFIEKLKVRRRNEVPQLTFAGNRPGTNLNIAWRAKDSGLGHHSVAVSNSACDKLSWLLKRIADFLSARSAALIQQLPGRGYSHPASLI